MKARVQLGALTPDDVSVQLVHGTLDALGDISRTHVASMSPNGTPRGGAWEYQGTISCRASGQYGFAVRVLPKHPDLQTPFEPGLVCWGA